MGNNIKFIMSAVFGVPISAIGDNTSQQTLEQWDSLNHMKLVAALEEEYDVTFLDSEILEMHNHKLIDLILREKKATT